MCTTMDAEVDVLLSAVVGEEDVVAGVVVVSTEVVVEKSLVV